MHHCLISKKLVLCYTRRVLYAISKENRLAIVTIQCTYEATGCAGGSVQRATETVSRTAVRVIADPGAEDRGQRSAGGGAVQPTESGGAAAATAERQHTAAGEWQTTLKLLLIVATNFSDFSEKPHNREIKYAHYFVSCINFA